MVKEAVVFEMEILSPLHMGASATQAGEYMVTRKHVPGSAMRGALAEVLLRNLCSKSETFQALFEGPTALRFEPAYPATAMAWGYPFPLTARACKMHGGFPEPDVRHPEHWHGAFDTLVSQVVFEELLAGGGGVPFLMRACCPHCWKDVEPVDGVYTWDSYGQRPDRPDALHLARHTHTAINRARGVAEDGMLFTLETLEPGTLLRGCGWVEAADAPQVREALPQIRRMGRGTRRGRGRVAIELIDAEAQGETAARVKALNARFQEAWDFYAALMGDAVPPPKPGTYFTLDLLAPAIFKDGVAATLVPPPLDLSIEVELVRRFAAPTLTEGWWQVAKLPYPTALAAQAGSVYLYRTLTPLSEEGIESLSAELDALRRRGIGEQRERGYGALLPCAPFHLWTAAQEAER